MPKVRCRDCDHFLLNPKSKPRSRYPGWTTYVYKGHCLSDKCAEETSGYTGMASSQKMTRQADSWRYCKFFKPLSEERLAKLKEEKEAKEKEWQDRLRSCIRCGKKENGMWSYGPESIGPFCRKCDNELSWDEKVNWLRTHPKEEV